MSLRTLRIQLPRNLCLAVLMGLVVTFAAAFAAGYTPIALILSPYGVDAPFGPLANVIRKLFLGFPCPVRGEHCAPGELWQDFCATYPAPDVAGCCRLGNNNFLGRFLAEYKAWAMDERP